MWNRMQNVKELQMKEYLKNTNMKLTASVKKTKNRSNLKQKKEEQKNDISRIKIENLKNIHESTKKESKIYQTEILKLKHEKDNAEELLKALFNANFNKIQISSATDKEQQYKNLIKYWKKNRV